MTGSHQGLCHGNPYLHIVSGHYRYRKSLRYLQPARMIWLALLARYMSGV